MATSSHARASAGARPSRLRPASFILSLFALLHCGTPGAASAQIARHPTGVNVNAQGATTVFISFANLNEYLPAEALWCGALVPAAPDTGERCDPSTVFGSLPTRLDLARRSGMDGMTDIMSIPPSVARRAYQAAESGQDSRFFYVRRFVDTRGVGPDEYVVVTCRLTGGGARTPFSLTQVRLRFATGDEVLGLSVGQPVPAIEAEVHYTGTGRLMGRWEVVLPGDEPPTEFDLLTEGTVPQELRGTQRRYTELSRFNVFMPPGGSMVLEGPPAARLPTEVSGLYRVLLRVEAVDDKEGNSDLAAIGARGGVVVSGAVAGFPLPALPYLVGGGTAAGLASLRLRALAPAPDSILPLGHDPVFHWSRAVGVSLYRLEVRREGAEDLALSALLQSGSTQYYSPPWLLDRVGDGVLEWRVVGLDGNGDPRETTLWRRARVGF